MVVDVGIGVASQLLFNTFHNSRLYHWERSGDLELAYGTARAHNRGMLAFCADDDRLLGGPRRTAGGRQGKGVFSGVSESLSSEAGWVVLLRSAPKGWAAIIITTIVSDLIDFVVLA